MRDALASIIMRTTLDIDDDVLIAAKEIGRRERKSAGLVLSELARATLSKPARKMFKESRPTHGFEPFPPAPGKIVTNQLIDHLRDQEGI